MDFDNFILRCYECYSLCFFDFYIINQICFIKYICPNNHIGNIELEQYIKNSNNFNINESKCLICEKSQKNSSIDYNYCPTCNKFICYKCLKKHNEHQNKCQIISSKFDGFCLKHLKCYLFYCKICRLNLCVDCKNNHESHDLIKIASNYIINSEESIKVILNNLENKKSNSLIDEKVIKIIDSSINFMKILLSTYKYEQSKNNLNFFPINNIIILFQKLERLNNYLDNQIKNNSTNYDDINYIFTNKIEKCIFNLSTYPDKITHLVLLKDGRLSSSTKEGKILIYSKKTYNIEIIINEHKSSIFYFTQLSNGNIISCSLDKEMKIIKINNLKYDTIQIIKDFEGGVTKVFEIEIENKIKLISLSNDKYIRIFQYNNKENKYDLEKKIQFSEFNCYGDGIIVNKNKELITILSEEKKLKFWDIKNFTNINTFSTIDTTYPCALCLLDNNILCIGGSNFKGFYLIQTSTHEIIKNIKGMTYIFSMIKCFDNSFIVSVYDSQKINSLIKYKFDKKNLDLIEISKKENAHNNIITSICELDDGEIATGSKDELLKIWI